MVIDNSHVDQDKGTAVNLAQASQGDLSPQMVRLARFLDRLKPDAAYTVSLVKERGGAIHWEVAESNIIRVFDA